MLGSRRRKKGNIHASTTPSLRADPRHDLHPVHEEGNLREIHLLAVEAHPPNPQRETRGHPKDRRSPLSGAATSSRSGEIRSNAVPRDSERISGVSRAWDEVPVEETPDYNELLAWGDSDNKERPISSNLAAVSESTKSLVKEVCTKRLPNSTCLQTRNAFPLPQVVATRTPQLDSFIKLEVP